jgi:hypothetical protein
MGVDHGDEDDVLRAIALCGADEFADAGHVVRDATR